MKLRAITVFDHLGPDVDAARLAELGAFAQTARQAYEDAGVEVQTLRLATSCFPALSQAADPAGEAAALEAACQEHGFAYIALGPAGRAALPLLPEIFAATAATFATAHIVHPDAGAVDGAILPEVADVVRAAAQIEEGFGNLRFAALANVPATTPFFPAAYHDGGSPAFALATEAADLAVAACEAANDVATAQRALRDSITAQAARLVAVAEDLTTRQGGLRFGGIDFSLAPFPTPACSIGAALEALSGQPLGSAGTLAAAATLTSAIAQATFPRAGFCGLMMPVLEDIVLAQRAAEGRLRVGELLQWSAVCGTGLDTVPLPGDVERSALARLLYDVAALSARLHKPLTARLMPLPGKVAGDPVHFDFPYFADGGVVPLDGASGDGLLLTSSP